MVRRNETLLSTTLSDMGFAHVAAEVARALAAEMASTCYCFNSSSSSWISAGDVLLDREEVLPAADTDLCAPASYTLCTGMVAHLRSSFAMWCFLLRVVFK